MLLPTQGRRGARALRVESLSVSSWTSSQLAQGAWPVGAQSPLTECTNGTVTPKVTIHHHQIWVETISSDVACDRLAATWECGQPCDRSRQGNSAAADSDGQGGSAERGGCHPWGRR